MDQEFWHRRWQNNQIGFNQSKPNALMRQYFDALKLPLGRRIFVPLCGKSIDMIWLAQQGYRVIGVELSMLASEAFFAEQGLEMRFTQEPSFNIFESEQISILSGDFFDLTPAILGEVDAIFDRAALIALPSPQRAKYAAHLLSLLKPHTPLFLVANTYPQNEMNGPPFSVDQQEIMELFGGVCHVQKLHDAPLNPIPPHLQSRGLCSMGEQVYLLHKR